MLSSIPKAVRQITGTKVTSVCTEKLKNSIFKLVNHTYSGEYFPLYKNANKNRVRNVNEYQGYD